MFSSRGLTPSQLVDWHTDSKGGRPLPAACASHAARSFGPITISLLAAATCHSAQHALSPRIRPIMVSDGAYR
eukprot:12724952-Alexandrium_andersonii.AAC.3